MSDETSIDKSELLSKMEAGWHDFSAYLQTLTHAQMTTLHDSVGWTIKDHLMHLAAWEDGISALLSGQDRLEAMHVDHVIWASDVDSINTAMQQHDKDLSVAEALHTLRNAHERMIAQIKLMSDADLRRPYRDWQPGSTSDVPIIEFILGNSCGHYEEHQPWIEAIAKATS